MLAAGGNAADAAVAALFALTVVEPMMVGLLGGGFAHVRLADGSHHVLEGQASCPATVGPTTFTPDPEAKKGSLDAVGRKNSVGRAAVGVPGNLLAWCTMLERWGTMPLADVVAPAIRHAERGFVATEYLASCVAECAADMALDPEISKVFLPGGKPIKAGDRVVNADYARTLEAVVRDGPSALYGGPLGKKVAEDMAANGGHMTEADLAGYRTHDLDVLHFTYRGHDIRGPPPPCAGPLHIGQMLGILEGLDVADTGFGTADGVHLIAEVTKIAFADRLAATADPAFVTVPVARLLSPEYAAERRAELDMKRAQSYQPGVEAGTPLAGPGVADPHSHTTHLTVADSSGMIFCCTFTINSLFGARYMVPGTGMIPNNYLYVFDPHPGRANSLAPGKRVTSSMSPLIVSRDGKPRLALGLPGGLKIFPSAMQAVVNLLDHGMSLQEAVEAPRVWTQGYDLEIEPGIAAAVVEELKKRGHDAVRVATVGGGMCAVAFGEDGAMQGAACWRADGTAIGVGGGMARKGVRFWPEARRDT
ncbi:putative gamma-glutamyltranspeptidase [Hyaloraphidium curvatum]|nr:putative gamma-glutamyltranspeptidase [Hyaloraphidium curvatum]